MEAITNGIPVWETTGDLTYAQMAGVCDGKWVTIPAFVEPNGEWVLDQPMEMGELRICAISSWAKN